MDSSASGGVEDSQELNIFEKDEERNSIPVLPVMSIAARKLNDSQEGEVELIGSYRDIQEFIMEFFPEARGPVVQAKRCSGQSLRFVRGMSEETSPSYSLSGIFMRW